VIDPERFRHAYRQAVTDVLALLTRDRLIALSTHDPGIHPDAYDAGYYLRQSETRYRRAIDLFNRHHRPQPQITALDVGGWLGAFPLALARLGIQTTVAEEYAYYGDALNELVALLKRDGVAIRAVDYTQPIKIYDRFDLVTNMAMIEHIPHTPKQLLDNLRNSLAPNGTLILDTPNIAYWPKRRQALRGESVHDAYCRWFDGGQPYVGHHRELTATELRDALTWTGFQVDELQIFNYSVNWREGRLRDRAYMFAKLMWPAVLFPSCREVLIVAAHTA
jgi:2-polyprenyl-3-methyl-5-hydroxy-6-metoxy-1,4-benzoquinol methylase